MPLDPAVQWCLLALRLAGLLYFAAYFFVKEFADGSLGSEWLVSCTGSKCCHCLQINANGK